MNRRFVVGTMVMAASLLTSGAVYAAPTSMLTPGHAMFSKAKMVSFKMRNDTATPITVKAGKTEMVLEPGKVTDFTLPVGQDVVAKNSTKGRVAGTILASVSEDIADHIITLQ